MDSLPGKPVKIFHNSKIGPFKSVVIGMNDTFISLRLVETFIEYDFKKGDIVQLEFEEGRVIWFLTCIVYEINMISNEIVFRMENMNKFNESRRFERFFVSLPANMYLNINEPGEPVVIKDISLGGLKIISEADFKLFELYNLMVPVHEDEINLGVESIRKNVQGSICEYGLKIISSSPHEIFLYKSFIEDIKFEHDMIISKLLEK